MLPAALRTLAASQNGVVSRQQALAGGLPARQWDRRAGGLLVPLLTGTAMVLEPGGPQSPGPLQQGRAALLSCPDPLAMLGKGSVLRARGAQGTPQGDPEHVMVSRAGWHPRRGVRRHHATVDPTEQEVRSGLAMTKLSRALVDAIRSYDRAHSVSVVDSALHQTLLRSHELPAIAARLSRERAGWLDLADPACESPLETRARLFFGDHGLPWESQVTVVLTGYGKARLDFLVAGTLVVECDGRSVHDAPNARYTDRHREEALRADGYEVIRLTWADLELRPAETLARLRAALARCR